MQILTGNIKEKTLSALMFRVEAYSSESGLFVGTGYVFYHKYGMTPATLINFLGEPLAEGWYQLRVTGESELVVMSRSVH